MIFIVNKFVEILKRRLFNIHDNAIKKYLNEQKISHYLFTYDLLEYDFKRVYQSFNISYFTKDNDLLKKFCNSDELRYYETIEKDNYSVLIKKFKLRVSVRNNEYFSDDIIVSDDCMFDFNNLNHTDSMIKIALVHDNVDNWIKSINDYDFVFTCNKEDRDLLKKHHSQVFVISGETVYLQLKNILNLLYMRKRNKFYQFINRKFNYVFPKVKHYFRISHSEFYDEEWYKNKYHILDNTDPVFHYMMVGYSKRYNPGPNFDSFEYHELNGDVKSADFNPLLHYEMYGRKEHRRCRFEEDEEYKKLYSIYDSPYFDEEWYVKTYDIPENCRDPVNHYLTTGFKKGYNPGPDFDNEEYYKCNPDVEKIGMNPLLHYEQHGRAENRRVHLD